MGLFDFVTDITKAIVKESTEAVVRAPEIPIKIIEGVKEGVEDGVDAVEKAVDDLTK